MLTNYRYKVVALFEDRETGNAEAVLPCPRINSGNSADQLSGQVVKENVKYLFLI
jgi:hypothetical protein